MADKEKQIEEIANILQRVYNAYGEFNAVWLAEHLSVNNIGKIPEGSVVLSKEEYRNEFKSRFNKGYKQARKETAREILKELYEQIDEKTPKWVETQIKMKAKQFGVEVDNDR